ncbi:MAG: hypothetical protein ABW157_09955 [Candidatus Thiodiazotropha sp. LLP2]
MEPATYGFIGALVGAIVGALASIATTYINTFNSTCLQTKADELLRIERSRYFQRDMLLNVQETLQNSLRNAVQIYHHDVVAHRENGKWQKSRLGDELNQRELAVNRDLTLLTERISNDKLREHIKAFRILIANTFRTNTEEEGDILLKQAVDEFNPLMEHIGKVLRELY